jgi:hypothetical protein
MPTFYCVMFETPPNLEGQVTVFIPTRNRVARFYPETLGSLFVASYDSQGYGGGIRPRLHIRSSLYRLRTPPPPTENAASFVFVFWFVDEGMYLPSTCLAIDVSSAFGRHVTILSCHTPGISVSLISSDFPTKFYKNIISHAYATCPTHLILHLENIMMMMVMMMIIDR